MHLCKDAKFCCFGGVKMRKFLWVGSLFSVKMRSSAEKENGRTMGDLKRKKKV